LSRGRERNPTGHGKAPHMPVAEMPPFPRPVRAEPTCDGRNEATGERCGEAAVYAIDTRAGTRNYCHGHVPSHPVTGARPAGLRRISVQG
jgi:hypothetical protein